MVKGKPNKKQYPKVFNRILWKMIIFVCERAGNYE